MLGHALTTFNPKNFTGIKLWLDAANPSNNATTPTDGSFFNTWVDLSGVSGNAISFGGVDPLYKKSIQNGLPGILFNGTSDYMSVASLTMPPTMSMFTVSTSSNNTLFIEHSVNVNSNDGFYIYGVGSSAANVTRSGVSVQQSDANWSGTSCVLLAMTYDGSNLLGYKNGSSAFSSTGSLSGNTTTASLYVGARGGSSLFMTGYIFEIILYSGLLTAGQQALVNDYLRRKWAIY